MLKFFAPAALIPFITATLLTTALVGCDRQTQAERVVIYTSVDEQFARQILGEFTTQTGIAVEAVYDTEAGKTTGFLMRLRREAERPRCDVWWSSEVFTSVQLADEGVLTPYESPAAADIDDAWKDPNHMWTGHAARARVLAYHTERVDPNTLPATWAGLADPKWASKMAIANPQFGTTRGHVAAMFAQWGPAAATDYLRQLKTAGATVAESNGHTVRLVGSGDVDLGWTDTDDVWVYQGRGLPLGLIYPKMADDGAALWIPCSAGLVQGGPNPETAKKLIDFLVSAEVERRLAASDSRNVPVRPALRAELDLPGPEPAPRDYAAINAAVEQAMQATSDILLQ